MNRSRVTGDLASHGNIFVDIANDRVGIGSTIPGQKLSLPDSAKIALGNSADLEIYHDGSHSYIHDGGTGNLKLRSNNFRVSNGDESKVSATFVSSGAVDLYFNNNLRLSSANYGANIFGQSAAVSFGLYTSGGDKRGGLYATNGNVISLLDAQDHQILRGVKDGAAELYHNNLKKLETLSTGVNVNGTLVDLGAAHYGDVQFTGDSANIIFDKSDDALEFADNAKATFGDSQDLQLYHSSSGGGNSYIDNSTGITFIRNTGTNGSQIQLLNNNSGFKIQALAGEQSILGVANGQVELYHNNTKTFQTTSFGAEVIFTSGGGNEAIFKVLHGNLSQGIGLGYNTIFATGTNTNVNLFLQSKGTSAIKLITASNETMLQATPNGAVELYHDNNLRLATAGNGVNITGYILSTNKVYSDEFVSYTQSNSHSVFIKARNAVGNEATLIKAIIGGAVELYHNTNKKLETSSTGVTITGRLNMTEGIDIPDGGDNNTSLSIGSGNDLRLYHDGSHSYIKDRGTGNLYIQSNHVNIDTDHGEQMINCIKDGAVELYHNNVKKAYTQNNGFYVTDTGQAAMSRVLSPSGYAARLDLTSDAGASHEDNYRIEVGTNQLLTIQGKPSGNYTTFFTMNQSGNALFGGTGVSQTNRQLVVGSNAEANLAIETHNTSASETANIRFYRSRGTAASPTTLVDGDVVSQLLFYGHDGTDYSNTAARIRVHCSSTVANNSVPSSLTFATFRASTTVCTEALRLTHMQDLTMGNGSGYSIWRGSANDQFCRYQFRQTTGDNRGFALLEERGDSNCVDLFISKSRGGSGKGVITSGDNLGTIKFSGADGTRQHNGAGIVAWTSGTIATGRIPTNLSFYTHPDSAGQFVERFRMQSVGRILFGNQMYDRGAELQYEGSSHAGVGIHRNSASHSSPALQFSKSRGTSAGSNTIVQENDYLGLIRFSGTDGTSSLASGAQITGIVDGTPGANDMPTRIGFWVSGDGSDSPTEQVRISSTGQMGIGRDSGGNVSTRAVLELNVPYSDVSDNDGSADLATNGHDALLINISGPGAQVGRNVGSIIWGAGRRRAAIMGEYQNTDSDYLALAFFTRGTDGANDFYKSFIINHNGSAGLHGSLSQNTSDDRLKKDKVEITNALDKVNSLSSFTHKWNDIAVRAGLEEGKEEIGLSAQEVQGLYPSLVSVNNVMKDPENPDVDYLTVHYEKVVPLLVASIKELTAKNKALEARLDALEGS